MVVIDQPIETTGKFIKSHDDRKAMRLADIQETLRAEVLVGHEKLDMPIRAGAATDLMSDLLRGPTDGVLLLTGLNNVQAIRSSVIAGVAAVVVVRDKRPTPEMITQAREHGIPLLACRLTLFSACGRLYNKGLRGVEGASSGSSRS